MFFKVKTPASFLGRIFNVDEWMVRLLGLSRIKEPSTRPGAVIIQVDGLGFGEFTRALRRGELPHLARLLKKEGYTACMHYPGQPSTTASIQGELFYGVKSCIPAFSYRDSKSGKIFNMLSIENAAELEKRMSKAGKPLLRGGSAYADVFTGGAQEPHFCVSSMGWGNFFRNAKPVAIAVFTAMHIHIIIRFCLLVIVELFLALYDSVRGAMAGRNLLDEIAYIPFRVMACVVVREVMGIGVKIDIARGMPVTHVNFMAYDEQAHHRGPKSRFAHWSLRAIDSVIRIIWKAAKNSARRDYEVFIYSDHGQEETVYYKTEHRVTVQEAVNRVFEEERLKAEFKVGKPRKFGDLIRNKPAAENGHETAAVITAQGDMGHIYPAKKLTMKQKYRIAARLVSSAKIPLAIVPGGPGRALAWNSGGKFTLPRDAEKVLGSGHPFMKETARDLVRLSRHKDAGEIIFSGFRKHGNPVTFYNERGSHGGPGPYETTGFAMIPPGITLLRGGKISNAGLRQAVFQALKRGSSRKLEMNEGSQQAGPVNLKIMSYNIHACKGRDGLVRPERIARVIAGHDPDIICLQEADTNEAAHQAEAIADILSMNYHYHSSVLLRSGQHGNAVLSRFDMKLVKRGPLPRLMRTPVLEPRGAIWVEVNAHGRRVQVINTHLSLFPLEGYLQAKHLLGKRWLSHPKCKGPVILCGDFNSLLNSRITRALEKKLHSIHFHVPGHRHLKTFPSIFPLGLVDHIFLSRDIKAVKIEIPGTHLEKTASDHLPLISTVRLE